MTDIHTLDTVAGENAAIIDVAQDAVRAQPIGNIDGLYYDAIRGTVVDVIDRVQQWLDQAPGRKTGTYKVTDTASFVGYLAKHATQQTEIWANVNAGTVRAVFNAHHAATGPGTSTSVDTSNADGVYEIPALGQAGHEDHTATLQLATTDDWKEWTAKDGDLQPQLVFAEFIEDHLPNFVNPSAADMLELAQTFQAKTKVDFESSQRVKSGETQISYKEEQATTAGKNGRLSIPDTFDLALQPFENGPTYRVQARFRYRISNGQLFLGYRLTRPKDVRKTAFDEVVAAVAADTGRAIWATA